MFPIRDTVMRRETPLAVWTLIAINVIVFLIELSLPQRTLEWVFYHFGLVPARYADVYFKAWFGPTADSIWPFITNMFLHGSWMHLIGNMWGLWIFGGSVEDRMGHWRFVSFYLICGIAASLTHYVTNLHSTIPALGASGAIAGVMGAYLLMFPTAQVITLIPLGFIPFFVPIPAVLFIGAWFLTQVFSGVCALVAPQFGGGIAWWAHIGGMVAGMALLPVFHRRSHFRDGIYSS
ncbi:rhomboid family intramembrane serine protease [Candidatus Acetothermia bacterium]|nr:MAG: rhomboid family intramembrane serine protease [Candidatus Acetothermia bacterium]